MDYKQYRTSRIIVTGFLAIAMSQAIILNSYIFALFAVLIGTVAMFFIKKQLKDILSDERDYAIARKSARYAMGIFSITGAVATFFFMFQRDIGPVYETIGSILAYSVCGLLLLYSTIFIYFERYGKQN